MGENHSQTISEGRLLKLTAADHGSVLNEGTALSGKVHAGAKGVSVHFRFRYRFDGKAREAALGAWPRETLDAIRLKFDETKLRVNRGTDPVGQKQAVEQKLRLEQEQLIQQQQEQAERQRVSAEQQLTVQDMFEAWHPEAMAENTARRAQAVRRMFELHLLPQAGAVPVLDVRPEHVRKIVRTLVAAQKHSAAVSLYLCTKAMFTWAGKRKPWRLLFELNPVEEVDIARLLPVDYQDWSERVLSDGEIIELRNHFETIRNAWDLHEGPRRGRLAKPMPREHVMACWIMLGTLARVNELCAARWVHVDFSKATWFIPPEQAKNRKGFTIHLSRFVLRLLRELHTMTGHTPFVLPHPKDETLPVTTYMLQCAISDRQSWGKRSSERSARAEVTASSLVLPDGQWSCHDLRRTGSTLMEVCGFDPAIVERCLNYSIETQANRKGLNARLLRAYHHYDYAKEMRAAWDALGDYLMNLDGGLTQITGPDAARVANDDTAEPPQVEAA